MTGKQPTDRRELAIRHTVGSIMSGRADLERVVERLIEQGFQPDEIDGIVKEAARRMNAVGKTADQEFYQTAINTGLLMLAIAVGIVMLVGYPEHGRGVGILNTAIVFGIGALAYGVFGKMFRR